MRRRKVIKLDDREITVWELRVRDIRELMERARAVGEDLSPDLLLSQVKDVMPLVTDLDPAILEEMAPSELRLLWEAFREVNADFFGLVRTGLLGEKAIPLRAG